MARYQIDAVSLKKKIEYPEDNLSNLKFQTIIELKSENFVFLDSFPV